MKITETNRLVIEKAELPDSSFFLKLMNSPNWIQFIGDRGIHNEDAAAEYIQKNLISSYEKHGYGLYKMSLKADGTPIGICGFVKRDYLDHADIGFGILPAYEGKGYTSEAAMALMTYGQQVLQLQPILAITTVENKGSRRLLEKIGLEEIGTVQPGDQKEDLLLFSN